MKEKGGKALKAELKLNSVNQIIKDTVIYEKGDDISSVSLVVKVVYASAKRE